MFFKFKFIISALFFMGCSQCFASLHSYEHTQDPPARRAINCHSPQLLEKFFQLEKQMVPTALKPREDIPFFKVTNPETGNVDFLLGTGHDIPFAFLPTSFRDLILQKVDEIYVEGESFLSLLGENDETLPW